MPIINITVREKIAHTIGNPHIVCGNSDYVVHFDFDAEWDAYETKTARFIWGGKYTDVLFEGTECPVPVIMDAYGVLVGVYAGELHTTTAAVIDTDKSILSGNATESEASAEMWESVDAVLRKKIDAPQVAKVGEVLTVEEVDEDGKPTKWKTQVVETAPPDWSENDSTKPGYVKNRTHYDSRQETEMFNVTVENITEDTYVKLSDVGIDVSKISKFCVVVVYKDPDGQDVTYEFISNATPTATDVSESYGMDEGSIIEYKFLDSVHDRIIILPYFKTSEAAVKYSNMPGIVEPGLYGHLYSGDIKDTFTAYGVSGELKTIDPKFIPFKLPYIIQEKEDGNVKIELPYEFIEGAKYRVVYTVSGGDLRIDECIGVYSSSKGKTGIYKGGDLESQISSNMYYVLSGSDSMWINYYWDQSMRPTFEGIYRVVEPGYSIPSYAIDGLKDSINAEIDKFEGRFYQTVLDEVGRWESLGSKSIAGDTNNIIMKELFGADAFDNMGRCLIKLDLIISDSQPVNATLSFIFDVTNAMNVSVVSSKENKKTYWFYFEKIHYGMFCVLFEGVSTVDFGAMTIKNIAWLNNQGFHSPKISTGNPGYNVIAKNTKVTMFKAKR